MQVSVYLLFDGQCAAAFAFYQQIFGGELSLITVGDSPLRAQPFGLYGALNDAFGARWIFHAVTPAQP